MAFKERPDFFVLDNQSRQFILIGLISCYIKHTVNKKKALNITRVAYLVVNDTEWKHPNHKPFNGHCQRIKDLLKY